VSRVGDRGERLISPELQEQRIRAAAKRAGVSVEILPAELDVSGGRMRRPILDQVIDGIESGIYEGVVVAAVDRLSRMGLADAVATVERIAAAKGGVVSDAEGLITDETPEGQFKRDIFLSMANLTLNRAKAGFAAAKRQAVERGYWPTNTAPLGYMIEHRKHGGDGTLRPDPATRHLPKLAMEMRAMGRSWAEIGRAIGRGPTGARKVVANRTYLGEIRLIVRGELVMNEHAHEPLVDRALFEAAQIDHPPPERRGNPPALLAGILRCASCGDTLGRSTAKRGSFYVCRPNKARRRCSAPAIVGSVGIERYVQEQFLAIVADLALEQVERGDLIKDASAALADVEAELDAFQRAISAAGVGAEHVAAGIRERVDRVDAARRALADAWATQRPSRLPSSLAEMWWDLPIEERRHVLRSSLSAVVVRKGRGDLPSRVRLIVDDPDTA
jgi:DNA invertase Pin-like site-specific DNA recombinase